ncbi:MAG TPA: PAS domain S-box protein, partial [Longimicrobiales bacterium]|nr:PAS domain S-box protein [Longimicrobiales bacterium]
MKRILTRVSTLPALASLLSFLMISWAMWAALDVRRTMPAVRERAESVHLLLGRIDRMDATLTAVVRLAASTGEDRWIGRYEELERELEASVDSLRTVTRALRPDRARGDSPATAPSSPQSDAAADGQSDAPSDASSGSSTVSGLAAMERAALALVRSGDRAGALAILESEPYAEAKAGYQRRKAVLLEDVRSAVEAAERRTDARLMSVVVASGASFLLLLIVWGVVVSARSAREQRRLEVRLRRSRERLRSIVDVSPLAIVRVNRDRRVQFWNRAAERIFGWTADEMLGQYYQAVPEGREAESDELFQRAFADESLNGVEIRRRRKDGSEVDLRVWNAAIRDDAGRVVGIVGVLADVTEQRVLEDRLRQAQRMEAVGRLAGGIAHDFNNVMTNVLGHTELLLERLPAGDAGRRDLEEIRRSADRAARLTSQLLAFSRQQVLKPVVLDLGEVLTSREDTIRRLLGDDIRLEIQVDPRLGRVEADRAQLEQAMVHLAVNARDAMPGGGALGIRVENADVAAPIPGPSDDILPGRYVRVVVTDTGAGMDEDTLSRAFEPFFTTKDVGAGTGLGLPSVFGIVKQSGGHCRVTSRPGHGTCVELFLPRVQKPLPTPAGASGSPSPIGSPDSAGSPDSPGSPDSAGSLGLPASPGPRDGSEAPSGRDAGGAETVLLVEDDDAVRTLLRRVLERRGYHILEAASPTEALLDVLPGHQAAVDLLV